MDDTSKTYDFASNPNAINHIVMAMKALISVIKSNTNVEIQCIGHFEMLFGFLSSSLCDRDKILKTLALEIVCLVSRNKECVTEISACEIFGLYLIALKDKDLRDMQLKVLETLSGLLNVPKMIKEGHSKGAVIYLLDLFCNSNNPQIRECCAELLSKMNADKLSGPKVGFLGFLLASMNRIRGYCLCLVNYRYKLFLKYPVSVHSSWVSFRLFK